MDVMARSTFTIYAFLDVIFAIEMTYPLAVVV